MARLTLREILQGEATQPYELSAARFVLEAPWCWPVDPVLVAAAREMTGRDKCQALAPGESCLVSVDGERATLWRWTQAWRKLSHVPLADDDARTNMNAWNLAGRCVPLIAVSRGWPAPRPPEFRALKIETLGPGKDERVLTGESFGLALALSYVSVLLDLPVSSDVIALAELDHSGMTRTVGGVRQKLAVVDAHALGVSKVLVHPDHQDDVRRWSSNIAPVPVRSLRDAIAYMWPRANEEMRARWRDVKVATRISASLYRIALGNSRDVFDWRPIAASGSLLSESLAADPVECRKARFTTDTAKRHMGPVERPLAWEELATLRSLPEPEWLQTVAHYVQAWADSGASAEDCIAASELAMREVPSSQRHSTHLMLMGAIGRALAAAGRYERAIEVLRGAIVEWRRLYEPDQASFPLCELIRLHGISGAIADLETAIADDVAWVRDPDAKLSDMSATFLALAVGRALIVLDQPGRGIAELTGDVPWHAAPPHVQTSRLRWLAKAATRLGRAQEAEAWRLELTSGDEPDINAELARLDVALEENTDLEHLLSALKSGPEGWEFQRLETEATRISGSGPSPRELGRYFSNRYRY